MRTGINQECLRSRRVGTTFRPIDRMLHNEPESELYSLSGIRSDEQPIGMRIHK